MIKLAIIDNDEVFLTRINIFFNSRYADELRVNTYSRLDLFEADSAVLKFDVIWSSKEFSQMIDDNQVRSKLVYITEEKNIASIDGIRAICKYQKPDVIYKYLLNVYSELESTSGIVYSSDENIKGKVILVSGLSGGVGTTSFALALSKKLAMSQFNVFYLTISAFNSPSELLNGDGQYGLSDVFYSMKSRKGNLSLKLKSLMKTDTFGFDYFDSWKTAIDMYNISDDDVFNLINELVNLNHYDYIVFDNQIKLSTGWTEFLTKVSNIILVSKNSSKCISNASKITDVFDILKNQNIVDLHDRTLIAYNQAITPIGVQTKHGVITNTARSRNSDPRSIVNDMCHYIKDGTL